MSKSETLKARLARSLDDANTVAPLPPKVPLKAGGKCSKVSVSLFDKDLKRLDALFDYMNKRGHRLAQSELIRIAIRSAPLSDLLVEAMNQSRMDDGRKAR
jgi:hypothetical protein